MPSPDHRRNPTGRTCSSESAPGLRGTSVGTGPRFAMRVLLAVIASWLPPFTPSCGFSAGTSVLWSSVGFPWSSSGSSDGLSEHLSCFQELWQLPWLFCRSTAPQCSWLLCSCIAFVWRGLLRCFCFARKDFSAHLYRYPYLTLALKQEARCRQPHPWDWVRLSARGRGYGALEGFWGTVLWGEVWGKHMALVP